VKRRGQYRAVSTAVSMFGRTGRARCQALLPTLIAGAIAPISLFGCGAGAPPPEQARGQETARTTGAPPREPPVKTGAASGGGIRAYLAAHFVDELWYGQLGSVAASGTLATVHAALPADAAGEATAGEICGAVLSSHEVRTAIVRYGTLSVTCKT